MAFRSASSATYTFASGNGATVDLGATNNYRYINATNVYNKGKADGAVSIVPVGKYHMWFYSSNNSAHKMNQSFTNTINLSAHPAYGTLLANVSDKSSVTPARVGSGETYFSCYRLKSDGTLSDFYSYNSTGVIDLNGYDYLWASHYCPSNLSAYYRLTFS